MGEIGSCVRKFGLKERSQVTPSMGGSFCVLFRFWGEVIDGSASGDWTRCTDSTCDWAKPNAGKHTNAKSRDFFMASLFSKVEQFELSHAGK